MTLSASDIQQLTQLAPNAAPAASDLLPTLPSGASALQAASLGQLAAFVLTSVKAFGAVGDGVTDDTGAIQGAINSGQALYFPPGVYLISSTLVLNQAANSGQVLRGAGPTAADGTGASKTVIRPAAGVGVALRIDGTPFGGYVQGFGVEDLTIDMVNMPDVATSVGVLQGQGFDGHYQAVRIINDGVNKTGFEFLAGAYVTELRKCQFGRVFFNGSSYYNRCTAITLTNCDIKGVNAVWALNITFIGGTIQGPYNPSNVVYLPPGQSPYGYTPNTAGLYVCPYVTIDSSLHMTFTGTDFENGGGYPATFNDGVHGSLNLISVVNVTNNASNTVFVNPGFEGCYLSDRGARTRAWPYQLVWPDYDTSVKPLAMAQSTATQSIPSGVETNIDLSGHQPIIDDNTYSWDPVGVQLTILQKGTYTVNASAVLNGLTNPAWQMRIRVNTSSGTFDSGFQAGYAAGYIGANVGFSLDCSPGDTIQLRVYQNSGTSIPLTGLPQDTFLTVAKH